LQKSIPILRPDRTGANSSSARRMRCPSASISSFGLNKGLNDAADDRALRAGVKLRW
jgi:hypothetical protein